MTAKARGRRDVLARHAQWLLDKALPRAATPYTRDRIRAELGAIRWALRIIDAAPDLADSLAHYPADQAVFEEDRVATS